LQQIRPDASLKLICIVDKMGRSCAEEWCHPTGLIASFMRSDTLHVSRAGLEQVADVAKRSPERVPGSSLGLQDGL
jgi:hypothetical protein